MTSGSVAEGPILSRAGFARLGLFALGVLVFFVVVEDYALLRVARYQALRRDIPNPGFNTLAYVSTYAACLASLVLLYCHAWRWVRWFALVATVLGTGVYLGFRSTNGYGFTFHEASILWSERAFVGDALVFFSRQYAGSVVVALVAAAVIGWVARVLVPRIRTPIVFVVPLVAVWANAELLEKTYSKVYETPLPFRVALLAWYAFDHRMLYYGERDAPYLEPRGEPLADHVIVVVGESIGGDMLGINGSSYDTTPFLASLGDGIVNYGVTSSPSNLSSTSNIILQSGLRPDQVPDTELRSLKNPNIFSYLQRAGYAAFFFDAQIYSDKPSNFMTGFDVNGLDGHVHVRRLNPGLPEYEMDFRALEMIRDRVVAHERTFTYFVTAGAHFPYDAKYPPTERVFEPTLAAGGEGGNLEKTLNSYANAIRWNVDGFSRRAIELFEPTQRRVLLIYTGDHGQSLAEAVDDAGVALQARPTRWPHATPVDPPLEQAMVPLFLLPVGPGVGEAVRSRYDPALRDRLSGFEIFPTVLQVAGYSPQDIRSHYTPSAFDLEAERPPRIFVSGNLWGIGGGFYQNWLIRSATYRNEFIPETRGSSQ